MISMRHAGDCSCSYSLVQEAQGRALVHPSQLRGAQLQHKPRRRQLQRCKAGLNVQAVYHACQLRCLLLPNSVLVLILSRKSTCRVQVIPQLSGDATTQTPPDLPSYLFKERIVYLVSVGPALAEWHAILLQLGLCCGSVVLNIA